MRHAEFIAVNTVLGNIKTSTSGTCHAFGFAKDASAYLGQIQYLFNRRFDLRIILRRLARAACQTLAHPLHVIRAAESL